MHMAQQWRMVRRDVGHRRDMHLRNDQDVNRRPGMDVVEGQYLLVLVDLLRRNLPGNDLAEQAIGIVTHFLLSVRWANSCKPDKPSRRASSASTCSGVRPK